MAIAIVGFSLKSRRLCHLIRRALYPDNRPPQTFKTTSNPKCYHRLFEGRGGRAKGKQYRQRRGVVVVRGNGIEERGSLLLSRHRSQLRPSGKPSSYPRLLRYCGCRFQYANPMRLGTQWILQSVLCPWQDSAVCAPVHAQVHALVHAQRSSARCQYFGC